ncbi:helix-turn-helix domain-containing protein [Zhaonella formicivorans]|jgi:cytoskeletal protein RodZ|uniref:helix-turn-helix domain-containing protein n=1 Tax=Zhaonella formicivorans TaxID=2528593 RepID=UPI0010D45912|nr:RodZ domain-containing protein [Zhaonella formicivorans]
MGRIGETLKEARESKNLTLRDAEAATKIRLKYLEALENEDFSELPGRVYIIGFLKSYAKFLELEDQALVEEYKATYRNEETAQTQALKSALPRQGETPQNKKLFKLAGLALIVALLFTINFIYQHNRKDVAGEKNMQPPPVLAEQKDEDPDSEPEPSVSTRSEPGDVPETGNANSDDLGQSQGVKVTVQVLPDAGLKSWIRVIADGKQIFSGILQAGEKREFNGDKLVAIKFGNAGAVRVTVNGQDQGIIGQMDDVVDKEYKIEDFN